MFANPNKFLFFAVQKNRVCNQPTDFMIGNNKVDIGSSVKLLSINIDNQLSSTKTSVTSVSNQTNNVLGRPKYFLGFKAKKVLINTFI